MTTEKELADTLRRDPVFLHKLIQSSEEDGENVWEKVLLLLVFLQKEGDLVSVLNRKKLVHSGGRDINVLPLHLACYHKAPVEIVLLMMKAAPDTVKERDEDGDAPVHYACMRGASLNVIRILVGEQVHTREVQGSQDRTPLHHFLAYYGDKDDLISPQVVQFLTSKKVVEKQDAQGRTPFTIFTDHANEVDKYMKTKGHSYEETGRNVDFQALSDNCREILYILMEQKPRGQWIFIREIRNLPWWLFYFALSHIHVQRILNKTIAFRFSSAVLTLDFYVHAILIVAYTSVASHKTMQSETVESGKTESLYDEGWEEPCLLFGVTYLALRELVQMMAMMYMKMLPRWLGDLWNWLDIASIIVLWFAVCHLMETTIWFLSVDSRLEDDSIRILVMVAGGLTWLQMFSVLKSTYLSFSVFVSGLLHVIMILVPFVITSGIILGAFALMYHIDSRDSVQCDAGGEVLGLTFCTLQDSFLRVYSMIVNGEIDEYDFTSKQSTMWLSILFGFLVIILLLNVLIAIVTDSYHDVKKRGTEVFWSHRYNMAIEFLAIMNAATCSGNVQQVADNESPQSESAYLVEEIVLNTLLDVVLDDHKSGRGAKSWDKLMVRLKDTTWWDKCLARWDVRFCGCSWRCLFLPLILLVKSVMILIVFPISKGIVLVVMTVWVLLGVATLGVLWPPQIREALFCPSVVSLESGVEYELRKEVKEISGNLEAMSNRIEEMKRELGGGIENISKMMTGKLVMVHEA